MGTIEVDADVLEGLDRSRRVGWAKFYDLARAIREGDATSVELILGGCRPRERQDWSQGYNAGYEDARYETQVDEEEHTSNETLEEGEPLWPTK